MEISDQLHSLTASLPVPIWLQDILSQIPPGHNYRNSDQEILPLQNKKENVQAPWQDHNCV
jgi:hypothetical protein